MVTMIVTLTWPGIKQWHLVHERNRTEILLSPVPNIFSGLPKTQKSRRPLCLSGAHHRLTGGFPAVQALCGAAPSVQRHVEHIMVLEHRGDLRGKDQPQRVVGWAAVFPTGVGCLGLGWGKEQPNRPLNMRNLDGSRHDKKKSKQQPMRMMHLEVPINLLQYKDSTG